MTEQERFEGHCIVELMGHNIIAGYVTEQVIGGAAMLRVDVPEVSEDRPKFTKFYASSAVYGITPTTEENVREAAGRIRARPIDLWVLPDPKRQLVAKVADPRDPEQEAILMDADDEHWDDDDDPEIVYGSHDDPDERPGKDIPF